MGLGFTLWVCSNYPPVGTGSGGIFDGVSNPVMGLQVVGRSILVSSNGSYIWNSAVQTFDNSGYCGTNLLFGSKTGSYTDYHNPSGLLGNGGPYSNNGFYPPLGNADFEQYDAFQVFSGLETSGAQQGYYNLPVSTTGQTA